MFFTHIPRHICHTECYTPDHRLFAVMLIRDAGAVDAAAMPLHIAMPSPTSLSMLYAVAAIDYTLLDIFAFIFAAYVVAVFTLIFLLRRYHACC